MKDEPAVPSHIALAMHASRSRARRKGISLQQVFREDLDRIKEIIEAVVERGVGVVSFLLSSQKMRQSSHFPLQVDTLEQLICGLREWDGLRDLGVKVRVMGKWYDLPTSVIDAIKGLISETQDNSTCVVNLCINYDGKEEIVDACRMIARRVETGKIDSSGIDQQAIKDQLYTSDLPPVDLLIKTGNAHRINAFLLWDISHATLVFPDKPWSRFSKADLRKAIARFQRFP